MHVDTVARRKVTFPSWAFLFGFVCRDLGLFYLSGVRCWFCYPCFVVPIAPIPSALAVALQSFQVFMHHARRPRDDELDRQVITSGFKVQPTPPPLPSTLIPICPIWHTFHSFTPLWLYFLFFHVNLFPHLFSDLQPIWLAL